MFLVEGPLKNNFVEGQPPLNELKYENIYQISSLITTWIEMGVIRVCGTAEWGKNFSWNTEFW